MVVTHYTGALGTLFSFFFKNTPLTNEKFC